LILPELLSATQLHDSRSVRICGAFSDWNPFPVERLPRIETDQPATILPVKSAAVVDLGLPIINRIHEDQDSPVLRTCQPSDRAIH
jgi:hypothetical protein